MVTDVDSADLATAASKSMDMFSGLELLQVGKADVQQMVEQLLAQALGNAFADIGAQVVAGGIEAGAKHGHDHHADKQQRYQAHVRVRYGRVEKHFEEKGLDQTDSSAENCQDDEKGYPGNLLSQFVSEEGERPLWHFAFDLRVHRSSPRSAIVGDGLNVAPAYRTMCVKGEMQGIGDMG